MQKVFKYIVLYIGVGLFFFAPGDLHGQQVIINAKGERIVIFPDGSWRYFEPSDSTLLKKQLKKGEILKSNEDFSSENYSDPTLNDEESRKQAAALISKLNDEESQARKTLISATNDKFNAEAKLKQANENQGLIEPDVLEGLEMAYAAHIEKVKLAKKIHNGLEKLSAKAVLLPGMEFAKREKEMAKLKAKYSVITNTPQENAPSARDIAKRSKTKKQNTKTTKPPRVKKDRNSDSIAKAPKVKKEKTPKPERQKKTSDDYVKAKKTKKPRSERPKKGADSNYAKVITPRVKKEKKVKARTDKNAEKMARAQDAGMETPKVRPVAIKTPRVKTVSKKYMSEPYSCNVAENVLDDVTLQRRIVMEPTVIFTHTDDELRPYFRDKDLLKCAANLSAISGFKYLTMEFKISSSNARKNFGSLQEGSLLRLKLLNGSFLNFFNIKTDRGRIDNYTGDTVFTGYYSLGKSAEKELLKSEVDKVRVVWSTGYEDYEIYELNFFIDQINCLNRN